MPTFTKTMNMIERVGIFQEVLFSNGIGVYEIKDIIPCSRSFKGTCVFTFTKGEDFDMYQEEIGKKIHAVVIGYAHIKPYQA